MSMGIFVSSHDPGDGQGHDQAAVDMASERGTSEQPQKKAKRPAPEKSVAARQTNSELLEDVVEAAREPTQS